MAQRAASYGEAVLHTPTGALHKNAFSDEAASFHYAMKHKRPNRLYKEANKLLLTHSPRQTVRSSPQSSAIP